MSAAGLSAHLRSGATTLCRAWKVLRKDGVCLGFTDHDLPLHFDGVSFAAQSGLTAKALQQSTGLSVDNTEAIGALSDAAVSEEDILAGRYDGAEVTAYLVNWADPDERMVLFRGTFGEIARKAGAFEVELRGLSEPLNRPQGRVFQSGCSAVIGDRQCGVDLAKPEFSLEARIAGVSGAQGLLLENLGGHPEGWFSTGTLTVQDGAAAGLRFAVREDRILEGVRFVTLWDSMTILPAPGDLVHLVAGCDGQARTCRGVFDNFLNFRGFPHIPGEDWLKRFPTAKGG